MSDLTVDLALLKKSAKQLKAIHREFSDIDEWKGEIRSAVGASELKSAMTDFIDNWDDNRKRLLESLENVGKWLKEHATPSKGADPTDLVVELLSRDSPNVDLSSGEVDGAVAVRREFVAKADPSHGVEVASRRVEYIASVPGDPARWFVAASSTVGGGNPRDELAEVLVEWFDAVMATFRWRFE
ncbi:hypothetical protein ABZ465_02440 [Streptomyces griseoincarnatus]